MLGSLHTQAPPFAKSYRPPNLGNVSTVELPRALWKENILPVFSINFYKFINWAQIIISTVFFLYFFSHYAKASCILRIFAYLLLHMIFHGLIFRPDFSFFTEFYFFMRIKCGRRFGKKTQSLKMSNLSKNKIIGNLCLRFSELTQNAVSEQLLK